MRSLTYNDLLPDIERARRHAREVGGDELGQAVAWLLDKHPNCTSSDLMHWVVLHRQESPNT